jgi:hypothetical protein
MAGAESQPKNDGKATGVIGVKFEMKEWPKETMRRKKRMRKSRNGVVSCAVRRYGML